MIVSTIRQLLDSEPGPVEAVAGTVSAVYERIVGGEGKKAWSIQNLMLAGDDGSKIKVKLWRRPEFDKVKCVGHKLYIVASSGKRSSGPVGLKTELDTYYKGETRLILTVQESCEVTFQAPAGFAQPASTAPVRPPMAPTAVPSRPTSTAPAPEPDVEPPPSDSDYLPSPEEIGPAPTEPQYVQPPTPPTQHHAPAPAQPSGPVDAKSAWANIDRAVLKYTRAYVRCVSAAKYVQDVCKTMNHDLPDARIQELATTFYVTLERGGLLPQIPNVDHPSMPSF